MNFQLYTETLSSEHLQDMKQAVWPKLAGSLPLNFYKKSPEITVTKLIEKTLPSMQTLAGVGVPSWWSALIDTPTEFGRLMHRWLHKSFCYLRDQSARLNQEVIGRSQEEISERLYGWLFDFLIQPQLTKAKTEETVNFLLLAGLALKEWVNHLAELLSQYPSSEPFKADLFFIACEFSVQMKITFPVNGQDRELLLKGQVDAILYDYIHEKFYLYEYKTGYHSHYIAPILQCILYHELLRRHCGDKLRLDAVLAFFAPTTTLVGFPESIPKSILSETKPVIVEETEQIDPPAKSPMIPAEIDEEANRQLQACIKSLSQLNLKVSPKGVQIGPRFIQLRIYPEANTTVNKIISKGEDLQVKMNLSRVPLITTGQGYIAVEVERSRPELITLQDPRFHQSPDTTRDGCYFPLGINVNGQPRWIDLADSNCVHLLIGGTTGSGKSVFIESMLQFIQRRYSSDRIQFTIIDPKQVTYTNYESSPFLLQPVIKSREGAINVLDRTVEEMNNRYKQFSNCKVNSIEEWNRKSGNPILPRWIVIFDEYADYMGEKDFKQAIENSLERLGYMARAAGIHMIIALQRPDAKTVSSRIKANLPGRIAFRVASHTESKIILDEVGAEALLGKGDMLAKVGAETIRLQAPIPLKE